MLFGCSKDWLGLRQSMLVVFSCRYSMSYDISISLLKKMFVRQVFVKALGEGETPLCLPKATMVNHTWPFSNSSAVPFEYSKPFPCHGGILQVLHPAQTPIFQNHFVKSKTRHRLSMAIPTVHDRGLGYSNRLHSAEVVHFTHTIR
jgi:hypothetical protein